MHPELEELSRRLDDMPAHLRERKQWLLWRFEPDPKRPEKPRKVPYYASGSRRYGDQGSERDLAKLVDLASAQQALLAGGYDGVGFAFLPEDGLIGVDIDNAIDAETGEVSERCRSIIDACATYAELSPSGRGVHIIGLGQTETFRVNSIGLEVYSGRQYFTCTGRHWMGSPTQLAEISPKVLRRLQATKEEARKATAKPARKQITDQPAPADNDFERVNAAALALLDNWVPQLFPSAKKQSGTGAWRVSSKDLGRNLEEDLSLHRNGISDFGQEKGLTAVDVVVEFGGKTPKDALHWLAGAVGMTLTKPSAPRRASGGSKQPPSTGSAEEGDGDDDDDWRDELLRSSSGGKKDCRENVYLCLLHHPMLKGLVGYDEFSHRVMKLKPPPWDSTPGEWTTNDDYLLGFFLAKRERLAIKAETTIIAGVAMAAFHGRFHPVHRYLDALPAWDGVERLAHWLHECLGAAEGEYSRLVGTWFLMGMVRRVREPGSQMDYMVVLEGIQGLKKSSALRALVGNPDWFADTPVRVGDKDAMLSLAGKWLYEIGEMESFNKAEVTAIKQYVSSRSDRVREPFARRPADRPRSGVFAGSTNASEYFKDPTGARRFWPIACNDEIDLAKLAQWRDQLFAEAIARLASADPEIRRYWPTRAEEEKYLVPEQEKREIVDPWYEKLSIWLRSKGLYGESGEQICDVKSFMTHELLVKALNVPVDRIDGGKQMSTRVGTIMAKLGWGKERDTDGDRLWRYYRPGSGGRDAVRRSRAEPAEDVVHEF